MSKPTERPMVPCGNCDGVGSAPMRDKYWQVLVLLRRLRKATSADVLPLLPPGSTRPVANKRLEYLRRNGFATRTLKQDSKTKPLWIYEPI